MHLLIANKVLHLLHFVVLGFNDICKNGKKLKVTEPRLKGIEEEFTTSRIKCTFSDLRLF